MARLASTGTTVGRVPLWLPLPGDPVPPHAGAMCILLRTSRESPAPGWPHSLCMGVWHFTDGWGQKVSGDLRGPCLGEVSGFGQLSPRDHVCPFQEKVVLRCVRPAGRRMGGKIRLA